MPAEIGGARKSPAEGMNEELVFQSSFLQSASYSRSSFTLTVNFKSGSSRVHRYIYPAVWEAWKLHPSKGQYYAKFIKGQNQSVETDRPLMVSDIKKAKEGKSIWHRPAKK